MNAQTSDAEFQTVTKSNSVQVATAIEDSTKSDNDKGEIQADKIKDNKITNSQNDEISIRQTPTADTSPDERATSETNVSKKAVTLADLIQVCRDRGVQVFDNKPNVPEAEKRWIEARQNIKSGQKRSVYERSSQYGSINELRSVSQKSEKSGKSRYNRPTTRSRRDRRRAKRSSRSTVTGEDGHADLDLDSDSVRHPQSGQGAHSSETSAVHRKTSAATKRDVLTVCSDYRKSSATTRRSKSSTRSILELFDDDADIDAEEVLQLRMRRKSKRRGETSTSGLVSIIQQKHLEIEAMSTILQAIADNKENNVTSQVSGLDTEKNSMANVTEKGTGLTDCQTSGIPANDCGNSPEYDCARNTETRINYEKHEGTNNNFSESSKNHTPTDLPVRASTPKPVVDSSDNADNITLESDPNPNNIEKGDLQDSLKNGDKTKGQSMNGKIDEMRITDGNITLVLYGVTAMPSSGNVENEPTSNGSSSGGSVSSMRVSDNTTHKNADQNVGNDSDLDQEGQGVQVISESNEMIDANNQRKEKVNGNSSLGTNNKEKECKQEINIENRGSTANRSSNSDSETVCRSDDRGRNFSYSIDEKGTNLEAGTTFEKLNSAGIDENQRAFSRSSEENLFNNSIESLKSDKNSLVANAEQRPLIDENIIFQGDLDSVASTNKRDEIQTVNGTESDHDGDKTYHSITPDQDEEKNKRTVSVLSSNTAIKPTTSDEGKYNMQDKTVTIMGTTEQVYLSNNTEENKRAVPKKSYGNGFLVSGVASENNGNSSDGNQTNDEATYSTVDNRNDISGTRSEGRLDRTYESENHANVRKNKKRIQRSIASSSKSEGLSTPSSGRSLFRRRLVRKKQTETRKNGGNSTRCIQSS